MPNDFYTHALGYELRVTGVPTTTAIGSIVQPTNISVLRLSEPISDLADHVYAKSSEMRSNIGKWEAEVESLNLILQLASYAKSARVLANESISLVPSVELIARASIEAGARAIWLLFPNETFEREARWLAHLRGDLDFRKKIENKSNINMQSKIFENFYTGVLSKFPENIPVPKQVPNMYEMLAEIKAPEKYLMYCRYSQQIHSGHYATAYYRKGLGSEKQFGEFISAEDWYLPLSCIWWFLATSAIMFEEKVAASSCHLVPQEIQRKFVEAQHQEFGDHA